jgi:hypothetical protein
MAKTRDHLARGTTALRLSNEDPYPLSGTIDAAGLGGLRASQGTRVGMRGYFPRAVFFFFFGFAVFSVLPEVASFFGRFGDTGSLLLWLAVLRCSLVCSRWAIPARPAAGRAARRYRSASPPCQSMEPFAATPETAIVNGCCKRERPAKVARRCVPVSLSRATVESRLSQQTTCQASGSSSDDQATCSWSRVARTTRRVSLPEPAASSRAGPVRPRGCLPPLAG